MLRKGLAGLAVSAVFAVIGGSAQAAYPGENGKVIYEHKADQFAFDTAAWTVTAGNPASARKLVQFEEATYNYVYSPNGRKIAFDAEVPSQEIVVMNANGRQPKVITSRITRCIGKVRPTWSPDGRKIAFQCLNSRGFNQHDIWSVNIDGSGIKQISRTHDAYAPAWSPLGDKIAYTTYGGAIYTVPSGGGQATLLSAAGPGQFGGSWQSVDWAPNGLALVGDTSGASGGIYTINASTGQTSANLAISGAEPTASPDGTKILYVGFGEPAPSSQLHLWMMNPDGSGKQQVTTNGYDRAPSWGPRVVR
jgi:Tol biopolymer transport system component